MSFINEQGFEWLTTAETAKEIRKVLKQEWPGIKFYVRSSVYSGGSSISVYFDGGERPENRWNVSEEMFQLVQKINEKLRPFAAIEGYGLDDGPIYRRGPMPGTNKYTGTNHVFVEPRLPYDIYQKRQKNSEN